MCHPSPLSRKPASLGGMQTAEGLQLSAPSGFASAAEEEQPPAKSHPSWGDHILSLSQPRAQRPRTRLRIGWGFVWLASPFVFSLLLNLVPSPFFSQALISNKHLASPIPISIPCLQHWQAGFPRIQTARAAAKSWLIPHLAGREDRITGGRRSTADPGTRQWSRRLLVTSWQGVPVEGRALSSGCSVSTLWGAYRK